jgi:hypothetical protein
MCSFRVVLTLLVLGLLVSAAVGISPSSSATADSDSLSCIVHDQKQDCGEQRPQATMSLIYMYSTVHQLSSMHGDEQQLIELTSATAHCSRTPCYVAYFAVPCCCHVTASCCGCWILRIPGHTAAGVRGTCMLLAGRPARPLVLHTSAGWTHLRCDKPATTR